MSTLEALMKAEQSLLDESIPYCHMSYVDCTCGHILRAAEGKQGYAGTAEMEVYPEYVRVIKEVAAALGWSGEMEDDSAIWYVSGHTSRITTVGMPTRQDALKTIRTAMLALQPAEPVVEYATT